MPKHAAYLARLEIESPVAEDISYYIAEVKEADFCRRAAVRLAELSAYALHREPFSESPVRARMLDALAEAEFDPDHKLGPRESAEIVRDVAVEIEENIAASLAGKPRGLKTGFSKLDEMTMGLRPGWLYILAARPGVGKTTLALQIALNVAIGGAHTHFVTIEQMDVDLMSKAIGHVGRIPLRSMLTGDMGEEEMERFSSATRDICASKIALDESSEGDLGNLEIICNRAKRQGKLAFLVVDYLQLMSISGAYFRSRNDELAKISRSLKKLAIKLKVPILALAQINRRGAEDGGAPQVHHIKDCGAIEQDADVIMILHKTDEGTIINVGKNRRGDTGEIAMDGDLAHSHFSEKSERRW